MEFKIGDKVKLIPPKKYPDIPYCLDENTIYTICHIIGYNYVILEEINNTALNQNLFRKVMWIEEYKK